MKIEITTDESAESSGVEVSLMGFDTRKYAKLFHMLSNTLYSDKPGSVTRELASNAYDSHLLAGKLDIPFTIKAPTFEDPYFEIRDYGVGLTEEDAISTILCYLGSSKDQTDDFIGGWGIGSKSPFAYATTYEVVVFKNREKTHFTCWKDESGLPQQAVLDKCETDEPDGVLMRMPVASNDVRVFDQSLLQYMNWTNYNVELRRGEQVVSPRVPTAEKDFGDFVVKVYPKGSGQRRLVYGGFSYAMDACVDNRYDYAGYWQKTQQKLRYGYDVAFVINRPNAVTFAMNRETIEQTERSRAFINKMVEEFGRLADAKHEIVNKLSEEFFSRSHHAKTLCEIDDFIVELNQEIEKQDSAFDTVFVSSKSKITYDFSNVSVIKYRGVYPLRRVEIEPKPTKEQFSLAYGRLTKPGPSARSDFFDGFSDTGKVLYVKAKSKDEALSIFASYPEFSGYDLTSLDIREVVIPQKTPSTYVRSRSPRTNPVPYCRATKKRYGWDKDNTYVLCDVIPDTDHSGSLYVEFFSTSSKIVYLVPTPLFLEETEDKENVIHLDDLEEIAQQRFYSVVDNWVDDDKERWSNFVRRISYEIQTIEGKVFRPTRELASRISKDIHLMTPYRFKQFMCSGGVSDELKQLVKKKVQNNTRVRMLKNQWNRVIMEKKKLSEYAHYVCLDVVHNGSDIANSILEVLKGKGIHV